MTSKDFYNSGIFFFQNKQYDKAIENFQKALQVDPHLIYAYSYIGNAYQEKKQYEEAIAYYERAIGINPADPTAYINAGITFQNTEQLEKATEYFRKALDIAPHIEQIYEYLGFSLTNQGRLNDALNIYKSLLKINSNSVIALTKIGSVLKQQGQINESESYFRSAIKIQPDNPTPYQSLLVNMLYNPRHDARTIFLEHLKFAKHFAEPLSLGGASHTNDRSISRRLKIGYISADFNQHSVSYFIEPVLVAHYREKFEVFCFSDVQDPDEVTSRIQGHSDQWRDIAGMSDEEVENLIQKDAIDILVDLAGHTAGNRMLLFARKPAPIQISWIGYPATTGLSAMDYKIVDNYTDPPGMTEQFYTEKLIRMPESSLCYKHDPESPDIGPLPALSTGHITFGSFNNFAKVCPEVIELWAKILMAVPGSCLIMKSNSLSDRWTKEYVLDMFLRLGIPGERIELFGWELSKRSHLELYNRVDIALDTFPYHGTTTTCEALWMGVPVVSLAGIAYASRTGVSLLSNAWLPELVAQTAGEYINAAITLSTDIGKLQRLRTGLRDMMLHSPLMDAVRFVFNLEDCYRRVWEIWCKT